MDSNIHTQKTGWASVALFLGAFCIASAPLFAKLSMDRDQAYVLAIASSGEGISPMGVAFWRFFLAIPIMVLWSLWQDKATLSASGSLGNDRMQKYSPQPFSLGNLSMIAAPGFFFALDLSCWHWAFQYTSVANATLEANFATILIAIYSYVFWKERYHWSFSFGIVLAFVGLAGLVGFSFEANPHGMIGDALGILTSFWYASYLLTVKSLVTRYGAARALVATTSVGSLVLAIMIVAGQQQWLPHDKDTWWYLIALAFVSQCMGQGFIAWGIARMRASIAAVILLLQPVMVALWGYIFLDQKLSSLQMLSGVFVLLGIMLTKLSHQKSIA